MHYKSGFFFFFFMIQIIITICFLLDPNCPQLWEHACDNGECISSLRVCDNIADCTDGSDEAGCDPCEYKYLIVINVVGYVFFVFQNGGWGGCIYYRLIWVKVFGVK